MLRLNKKDGFASFVEIIITSLIFIISALGIYITVSMLRPIGAESTKRLEAVYLGKELLDQFRAEVDARTWSASNHLNPGSSYSMTSGNYTMNWTVETVPGLELRKVEMSITF